LVRRKTAYYVHSHPFLFSQAPLPLAGRNISSMISLPDEAAQPTCRQIQILTNRSPRWEILVPTEISSSSVSSGESRLGSARIVLSQERWGQEKGQRTRKIEKEIGGQTTAVDGGWQERLMKEKDETGRWENRIESRLPWYRPGSPFWPSWLVA
jgi:hypothetical protein